MTLERTVYTDRASTGRTVWGGYIATGEGLGVQLYIPRPGASPQAAWRLGQGDQLVKEWLTTRVFIFSLVPAILTAVGAAIVQNLAIDRVTLMPFLIAFAVGVLGAIIMIRYERHHTSATGDVRVVRTADDRIMRLTNSILEQRQRFAHRDGSTTFDDALVEGIQQILWAAADSAYADFEGVERPLTDLLNAVERRNGALRWAQGGEDRYFEFDEPDTHVPAADPEAYAIAQHLIDQLDYETKIAYGNTDDELSE